MTSDEHILLIIMLTKQLQLTKTLVELLRSRGVLDADDFQAFGALVRSDENMSAEMLKDTRNLYLKAAKGLGLRFPG